MRLLNTSTLELEDVGDGSYQYDQYAILSHTWGTREVTFHDISRGPLANDASDKPIDARAWTKVRRSCEIAAEAGYRHIWIDSCCIDKTSSAELSEAINSMFRWYAEADICIAYLEDVPSDETDLQNRFTQSRWFTRGWTLQELIAPKKVIFYSQEWSRLGTRASLRGMIYPITGIPREMLEFGPQGSLAEQGVSYPETRLKTLTVAHRMSWAAKRQTTRPEDLAYSLMGLFDINMPLLYGEGGMKAFRRLQEEIIKSTVDETIYMWLSAPSDVTDSKTKHHGLLATHPSQFQDARCRMSNRPKYVARISRNMPTVTAQGLQINLSLSALPSDGSGTLFLVVLACDMYFDFIEQREYAPVLLLQRTSSWNQSEFIRIRSDLKMSASRNEVILPAGAGQETPQKVHLGEPSLRPVFVPHDKPYVNLPQGFLFDMEEAFGRHSSPMPHWEVVQRSGCWQTSSDSQQRLEGAPLRGERLELNFERDPIPDRAWREVVILGILWLENKKPGAQFGSRLCLVVGTQPLEPHPLRTQAFFHEPWVAFETWDNVGVQKYDALKTKNGRLRNANLKPAVELSLDLASRYARVFYNIKISEHDVYRLKPAFYGCLNLA